MCNCRKPPRIIPDGPNKSPTFSSFTGSVLLPATTSYVYCAVQSFAYKRAAIKSCPASVIFFIDRRFALSKGFAAGMNGLERNKFVDRCCLKTFFHQPCNK
ncbi:MAG TPA: hypothetical protein DCP92_25055 [Nitrospiraceae bacterium]|nr:hypothetical protein [Nitrospiraceae bacterium]